MKLSAILRAASRALAFVIYISSAILWQSFALLVSRRARQRPARAAWLHRVAARCAQILHLQIYRHGSLPYTGLLVANHLSYIDIILLAALRPCVFVSKMEVEAWPLFGDCARLGGTIFVNRSRRGMVASVAKEIDDALDAGVLVVLFPEGTSSCGTTVLPFKSALLEPVLHHHRPVVAATISYRLDEGSVTNEICYWRDMTLLPHLLNVWSKPTFSGTLRCGTARPRYGDRKSLARELHEEVAALHAASTRELGVRPPETVEQPLPVLVCGGKAAAEAENAGRVV